MTWPDAVLVAFAVFCRVGSCLMLMPGFSVTRVPSKIRLFLAFSLALAFTPALSGQIDKALLQGAPLNLIKLFITEVLTGALIGFLGRIYFGAIETLGSVVAMCIGMTSALAAPIDQNEPLPAIVTLITLTSAVLIFVTDLHWEIIRGLAASYSVLPLSGLFDARFDLVQVADCLAKAFYVSLRISSPFIVYALVVNFAIALGSKLVPHIPIYFITAPVVAAGGLALFYATCKTFLEFFVDAFSHWLATG